MNKDLLNKNPWLPKRNRCTTGKKSPRKFGIFTLQNIRTAIVLVTVRMRTSIKPVLHKHRSTHMLRSGNTFSYAKQSWLELLNCVEYPHVLCILMALRSDIAKLQAKGSRTFLRAGLNRPSLTGNKLK